MLVVEKPVAGKYRVLHYLQYEYQDHATRMPPVFVTTIPVCVGVDRQAVSAC